MKQLFPVYSISKPFLAQAILELGIPLEIQIGEFLEDLDAVYATRKVGDLLNHTSGLSDYGQLKSYHDAVNRREPAWSRTYLLSACADLENNRTGFHYSNVGYLLLRMLIEKKTSNTFFGALNDLVFSPLGIQGFEEWEDVSPLVSGYDPRWVYSGTFLADAESIKRGFVTLVRHRAETIGLDAGMTLLPYQGTGFDHPGYSYGFMNDVDLSSGQPNFVGHGGGGPGFAHMILVNTANWQVGLETSTADFDQAASIFRLRAATTN